MEFINITFTDPTEKHLNDCVKAFNELCECGQYPKILQYTHYQLAEMSSCPDVNAWKQFLLHPKIKEWYQSERLINLNSQIQKLIDEAGSSHSTAAAQTLNTLLAQQKQMEEAQQNKTIIVYNFVPLTPEEEGNPNINVVQNIPDGIRRAIRRVDGNTDKSTK